MLQLEPIFDQIACEQNTVDWYAENYHSGTQCVENAATNATPITAMIIITVIGFQYAEIRLEFVEDPDLFGVTHDYAQPGLAEQLY